MSNDLVEGHVKLTVIDDPAEIVRCESPKGKPFLRLTFGDGTVKNVSTNIAEMIGGAGTGARLRYEDTLKGAN